MWVVCWHILHKTKCFQFFHTFMIGCFGIYLAGFHYFFSRNTSWIFEPVHVPTLKKCQIERNVGWIYCGFVIDFVEKAGEVFDVIHCLSIKMVVLSIKTFILQSQTSQAPLQLFLVVSILFFHQFF